MSGKITYTEPSETRAFIGVWVDGKPAGRIREKGGLFLAYTNKRAPGEPGSLRGKFDTREEAGAAVADAHRTL